MENKQNNIGVVTIILSIIVLCLIGYIGYDKLIKKDSSASTPNIETDNKVNETTTTPTTDYNQDENLKFYYYTTKGDDSTRYSLTLLKRSDNNNGFFTIECFGGLDKYTISGDYTIIDNKLSLSVGPFVKDNDLSVEENTFKDLGVTLSKDNNQENYKVYTTNYNEDELKIGNYTFYKVK